MWASLGSASVEVEGQSIQSSFGDPVCFPTDYQWLWYIVKWSATVRFVFVAIAGEILECCSELRWFPRLTWFLSWHLLEVGCFVFVVSALL